MIKENHQTKESPSNWLSHERTMKQSCFMVLIILKHHQEIADMVWRLVLKKAELKDGKDTESLNHLLGESCPPTRNLY